MAAKKTWKEKLYNSNGLPKVQVIDENMSQRWGTGTFVIPAPLEVYEIMKSVPEGRLVTINEIRQSLAKKHGTTISCPLTTGIFAWVSANASEEIKANGEDEGIPYWRTLKSDGSLNEKYPGGIEQQKFYLETEGHKVIQKGKKYFVENFKKCLAQL
ncbi:MGMT family protein [bacterium]|nr:MGMT family protein [bacterium]